MEMTVKPVSFAAYMAKVDLALLKKCGLTNRDLCDIDYLSLFEDGVSPARAAAKAIKNEGGM